MRGEGRIGVPDSAFTTSSALALVVSRAPHEFVTVDMRGLKAALLERSRVDRASVSSLVRGYVVVGLGRHPEHQPIDKVHGGSGDAPRTRLSVAVSKEEANDFTAGARRAGLTRAAYLIELMGVASQIDSAELRTARTAALAAANSELSTLVRNVRQLRDLLLVRPAVESTRDCALLDAIAGEARRHLELSAALLGDGRRSRVEGAPLKKKRPGRG